MRLLLALVGSWRKWVSRASRTRERMWAGRDWNWLTASGARMISKATLARV